MAEAFLLSALLPLVLDKSAALIYQQLGKIWGGDVERELRRLQGTLATIRGVLDDAEAKQVRDEAVRLWLSNLKDATYDADDLLEDFNLQILRRRHRRRRAEEEKEARDRMIMMMRSKVCDFFSSRHNPLLFNTRMVRQVKAIAERFDYLAAQRFKHHLIPNNGVVNDAHASRPQTHSYVPQSEVIGREADAKRMVELLIAEESEKKVGVRVLPIVGMGGLGKTTLAQMVYNDQRVKEHFELRMWLSITHDFSVDRIAKAMIETASGSGFGPSDMDSLQRSLSQVIGVKRYLLALDDVWNEEPERWEALKVLLTFGVQGSAVIVTTRSGIVSSLMGTLGPYRLAELSDDDCWTLFKHRAFGGGAEEEERPNLVAIGKEIVKKCGGLPLAAKALGSAMRLKREDREWRSVMESEIWGLPAGRSGILPALSLSYYHLPPHLKQCFAFCAIFPRGYEIEKELLIELWMANGLIRSVASTESDLGGHAVFDELEQRSFFQDVKDQVRRWYRGRRMTTCRMHNLVHDLAKSIMGYECCILDKWEDIASSTFHHMLVNAAAAGIAPSSKESQTRLDSPTAKKVRTLLFEGNLPSSFVDCPRVAWPNTKYLRVLGLRNIGMSEFPISICNLRHLRYLDLSSNYIQTLPEAICKLFNLQTLNLSACGLLLRLPESLRFMSSLVHLYLEGCMSLRCMPSGMGQLRYLQTLTRYTAGSEARSGSIADLKDLNLHGMLQLYNLKNVEKVVDAEEANLGSKENLQQLDLDWGELAQFRAGITEEVLQALQPHQNLKELNICRYKGTKFPTWLMGDYTMLLVNLVEIILVDCSRCEHLPQLWRLPSLEVLEIGSMESVKHLGGSNFYGTSSAVVQDDTVFPSLRKLKLFEMCKLEEWSGVEGRPFPRIVEIEIIDCPELRTMPALPSARVLRLRNCPLLRPPNGFFGCMKTLERLEMYSCDKLTLMLEQEDESVDSLRHLQIEHYQWLMFSSPSLGLWKYFNHLQSLVIISCDGLVMLPVVVVQGLSSLRRLVIHRCENLIGSSSSEGLQFQGLLALEELDIQWCNELRRFHPDGLQNLKALKELLVCENQGLTTLPEFPEFVQDVTIYNCCELISLPKGLGRLTALKRFVIISLPKVTSLPEEEIQGYKALKSLQIEGCPGLISLPVGLQRRLPSLDTIKITGCPDLQQRCMRGGEYRHLVSTIPVRFIGGGSL